MSQKPMRYLLAVMFVASLATHAVADDHEDSDEKGTGRPAKIVTVDCSKGQSLAKALKRTAEDLRIEFRGTCIEDVVVDHTNLTIVGLELNRASTIVGGIVASVEFGRAERLFLENLTVRDGFGIQTVGTYASLSSVTVENATPWGVLAALDAFVRVEDLTTSGANGAGMLVYAADSVVGGAILAHDNGIGIVVTHGGTLATAASSVADIEVHDNAGEGIAVGQGSSFRIENVGTLSAHDNARGIALVEDGTFVKWNSGTVDIRDNSSVGIVLFHGGSLRFHSASTLTATGNPGGDLLSIGGNSLIDGNVAISAVELQFGATLALEGPSVGVGAVNNSDGTGLCRGAGLPACP